jgi:hypothetical protein
MAVADDVNRLAALDVVYLSRSILGSGNSTATQVFRGRLRQTLLSNWVFNAFTGQNGVVGFDLGGVTGNWSSSESPATGIQVMISNSLSTTPAIVERIFLTPVIPTDFTE